MAVVVVALALVRGAACCCCSIFASARTHSRTFWLAKTHTHTHALLALYALEHARCGAKKHVFHSDRWKINNRVDGDDSDDGDSAHTAPRTAK